MKSLILLSVLEICLCASAAEVAKSPANETTKTDAAERSKIVHEVYERKFGGFVVQPGSMAGKIGFVNTQSDLSKDEIIKVIAMIKRGMAYDIEMLDATFPSPLPTAKDLTAKGLKVAIYVVSSDSLPSILVSPEENWSIVNVKKCKAGLSDDVLGKRLFALRCRGELMRGFAQSCGIWTSDYKDNILNVCSPKELDSIKGDSLVADILQRCKAHLTRIGVTQERKVMYTRACTEGWAPAPTNEYQKAIWDKVHAIPTKPITIEPEKAPVKK